MMKRTLACLALLVAAASPAAAQTTPLGSARELYASARYDEALAMLNGLPPADAANPGERTSIEQYRSLCLLALGRGNEAEQAIAAVVKADPTYHPSEAEASPRVRTAFTDVRRRLLPEIARARYAEAKGSFEHRDFGQAGEQFRGLLSLLDDPDMGGQLSDLRVLTAGFLDLSVASAAPPPPPPAPEPAKPVEPARPDVEPAPAAAPPAPLPAPGRIFMGDDPGVIAPTVIKQDLPRVPVQASNRTSDKGVLEIIIDDQGRVVSATVRMSIHPIYDSMLLVAARDWKFRPATVNGQPVKFRKMLNVAVSR